MADAPVSKKDFDALQRQVDALQKQVTALQRDGTHVHEMITDHQRYVDELRVWSMAEEAARLKDDAKLNADRARETAELNKAFEIVQNRISLLESKVNEVIKATNPR